MASEADKIADVGTAISEALKVTDDSVVAQVLQAFGQELTDDLIQSLNKEGAIASGGLAQSISFTVQIFGQAYQFQLTLADYYKFIDEGVQGSQSSAKAPKSPFRYTNKRPPVNFSDIGGASLLQWSRQRGLNEYAVRESIFKTGTRPQPFFSNVVTDARFDMLVETLEKALGQSIELNVARLT